MRLNVLYEAPGAICPQCGSVCQMTRNSQTVCPECGFVFYKKPMGNIQEPDLVTPELAVSGRWGGPFADKFSATKYKNPYRITGA